MLKQNHSSVISEKNKKKVETELALRIVSIKKTFKKTETYTKKNRFKKRNVIEMKIYTTLPKPLSFYFNSLFSVTLHLDLGTFSLAIIRFATVRFKLQ